MLNEILLYIAGAITTTWGISHLIPTKNVVKGFGDITEDNKNIVAMEWITEGAALIFIGIIIIGTTFIGNMNDTTLFIYYSSIVMLLALSVISLFTGFKINFLPFRLCPYLFTTSAILIFLGIYI